MGGKFIAILLLSAGVESYSESDNAPDGLLAEYGTSRRSLMSKAMKKNAEIAVAAASSVAALGLAVGLGVRYGLRGVGDVAEGGATPETSGRPATTSTPAPTTTTARLRGVVGVDEGGLRGVEDVAEGATAFLGPVPLAQALTARRKHNDPEEEDTKEEETEDEKDIKEEVAAEEVAAAEEQYELEDTKHNCKNYIEYCTNPNMYNVCKKSCTGFLRERLARSAPVESVAEGAQELLENGAYCGFVGYGKSGCAGRCKSGLYMLDWCVGMAREGETNLENGAYCGFAGHGKSGCAGRCKSGHYFLDWCTSQSLAGFLGL